MRLYGLVVLTVLVSTPTMAAGIGSAVTTTAAKDCQTLTYVREDHNGVRLPRKDWVQDISRCKGAGGWYVYLSNGGDHQGIAFAQAAHKTGHDGFQVLPGFGVVDSQIEWRGPSINGALQPAAAILRFNWQDLDDGRQRRSLAVARLGKDAATTCFFVYVDIRPDQDAEVIAAGLADQKAAGINCSDVTPGFVGKALKERNRRLAIDELSSNSSAEQ